MQLDLEYETADGPQTAGLVIEPFHSVVEDMFGTKRNVNLLLL